MTVSFGGFRVSGLNSEVGSGGLGLGSRVIRGLNRRHGVLSSSVANRPDPQP